MEINANFGQQVSELARSDNRTGGIGKEVSATARTSKELQNRALLDASLNVSIDAGNRSLELLYRTAIEKLNEVLAQDMGANVLRDALDSDLDVSPEATADRILTLSTAYLPLYLEQHPGQNEGDGHAQFTDLIRDGIGQGFAEAREILQGLGVLEGDIADNIDRTWTLVQLGLDAFLGKTAEEDSV
ncbi:MAG: DUF5610 domain-containing protein [Oceanospirillaceae bacterium]|nr:DUF5610 domain-containing protein [Oceanospirillaceae bacterium]